MSSRVKSAERENVELIIGIVLFALVILVIFFIWKFTTKKKLTIARISELVMDNSILDTEIKRLLLKKKVRIEDQPIDINLTLKNIATFKCGYVEFIVTTSSKKNVCDGTFQITKITRLRDKINDQTVIMLVKINLDPA